MHLFGWSHELFSSISLATALVFIGQLSHAGPLRDRIVANHFTQNSDDVDADGESPRPVTLPTGVRLMRDVAYGTDDRQRMDVYLPQQPVGAPVIFMVHGGAWRVGDKAAQAVVENKVTRWVSKGFIFISTNYRMLPKTGPVEQAHDIVSALATAQGKARSWGGDPSKFILMGHSAGGHLVALLAASPDLALKAGAKRWLGAILLDSAALDVVEIMEAKHSRLFNQAFGGDAAYWRKASPFHVISETATPFLAVCSTHRNDSCPQATRFVTKATSLNVRASILKQPVSHKEINQTLGLEGSYTDAVESFMGALDESVAQRLLRRP